MPTLEELKEQYADLKAENEALVAHRDALLEIAKLTDANAALQGQINTLQAQINSTVSN